MKINFVGEKSLSYFIYKILKYFLGICILTVPFGFISMIFLYLKGGNSFYELNSDLGIRLTFIQQANNHFIASYHFKSILYNIPSIIISFIICYNLMEIFGAFSRNNIFDIENFKRSKVIGTFIIIECALGNIGSYISALTINNMSTNGITFHIDITSLLLDEGYIVGLMIIIISEIFRRAIIIKNDQDLTI